MRKMITTIPRPLLVLITILIGKWFTESGRKASVLGTRTMSAMKDFKEGLGPIAAKVEAETGISAKIGMGQLAHESAFGTSQLARPDAQLKIMPTGKVGPANNLAGFTAGPDTYWRKQGLPYVDMPTTEWRLNAATGKKEPYKTA